MALGLGFARATETDIWVLRIQRQVSRLCPSRERELTFLDSRRDASEMEPEG